MADATIEDQEKSTSIKAVLFDIDGTLADSFRLAFDATNQVLQNHQVDVVDEAGYHEGCRYTTPERLARHAGLMPGDDTFDSVGQQLGKEFDDLYIGLVSPETAPFFPGILELLHSVKSEIYLGCLTNAANEYAHAVLRAHAIHERFGSIRGADTVPKAKPAPDGLWQVCKDLQLEASDCIYVGDSPGDAKAAMAAGMTFIGVSWGSFSKESLIEVTAEADSDRPRYICDTVDELKKVLAKHATIT